MRTWCRDLPCTDGAGNEVSPSKPAEEAGARATRVAELRAAIASGAYRPSATDVAATLVWAWEGHRVAGPNH